MLAKFWWGVKEDERKIHWMSQDRMSKAGTEDHLFLNCHDAKFTPLMGFQIPGNGYIKSCLLNQFHCKDQRGAQHVCATLWNIWQGRKQQIFQQKNFNSVEIVQGVVDLDEDFSQANSSIKSQWQTTMAVIWYQIQLLSLWLMLMRGAFRWQKLHGGCIVKSKDGATVLQTCKKQRVQWNLVWLRCQGVCGVWRRQETSIREVS